jgi:tetratricopeptide (TPR) repeat protein
MNLHYIGPSRIGCSNAWRFFALILIVTTSILTSMSAFAQASIAQLNREYFIRQAADEALLIRVTGYEADLNSLIYAPERKLLLSSSTNGSRIAPLFQFIDSSGKDRQLDIQVSSEHFTANSQFEIGVTRLKVWDNRSQTLAKAYSLLSFGMQTTTVDSAANWTVKINSLTSAANTFAQFGMTELTLWSNWFATWLIQTGLHDYNLVLGMIQEIQNTTRASQWSEINLAAQQTKTAAITNLLDLGRGQAANIGPQEAQIALAQTAEQANGMGYRLVQSQALYESGLQYANQNDDDQALKQYQLALSIADDIGDAGLSKSIREQIADIHEEQGDDPATSEVLRQLEDQLNLDGQGGDELALNLLQQGRIFMRSWQFTQAQEVLKQALEFENNSSIASQINLELARVSYETGQTKEAPEYLAAAGISRAEIGGYFDATSNAAILDASGFRKQAEASYQSAQNLAKAGRKGEAQQVLESLIDNVLFLRQALPGVLGSWYWQRREDLIDDYLDLGVTDQTDVLLALSRSRYASKPSRMNRAENDLRAMLAQSEGRGATGNLPELERLREQFARQFSFLSTQGVRDYLNSMTADSVMLTYHLSSRNAVVWVAGQNGVQSQKLANPKQLHNQLETILERIPTVTDLQFDSIMKELNDLLISPVSDLLRSNVYLVAAGLTLSLPFDGIRLDGRYLAEKHTVIKVMSFPSPKPDGQMVFDPPKQVFLAGDPQNFQSGYANQLQQTQQIRTVTEFFVGPGLNIIQGTALLPDEFQSEPYRQAELIHLSMPGLISLDYPDKSTLQLSEPLRDLGRLSLRPVNIRGTAVTAGLVYLADTNTQGLPNASSSQHIGLVSDFLQAGTRAVIGQISPLPESAEQAFIQEFYSQLALTRDIATAFSNTKRAAIGDSSADAPKAWAALQLFTD